MNRIKLAVFLIFTAILLTFTIGNVVNAYQKVKPAAKPATSPTPGKTDGTPGAAPTAAGGKYSEKFDHNAKANEGSLKKAHEVLTKAQNCETCHERVNDDPKTQLPYHDSCVKCHANQFTDAKLEICNDCHSKPYNDKPAVFSMDVLNQFGMEFSHTAHKARADFKCETCHLTPADNKTARSTYPKHLECFTCHKATSVPAKGSCNECHNQDAKAQKFRTRGQINIAYDFFKFNHGKHLAVGKSCEECHDVLQSDATTATDISRFKVIPTTDVNKAHTSNCFKCHQKIAKSGTPDADCNRCHVVQIGQLGGRLPKQYLQQ